MIIRVCVRSEAYGLVAFVCDDLVFGWRLQCRGSYAYRLTVKRKTFFERSMSRLGASPGCFESGKRKTGASAQTAQPIGFLRVLPLFPESYRHRLSFSLTTKDPDIGLR